MSLDKLLTGIAASLDQTAAVVQAQHTPHELPPIVQQLSATLLQPLEGMSLLAAKSNAMLAYVNNLALVVLAHVERLSGNADGARDAAVRGTVQQRVAMEKGIKPLEKKLAYQLDKMVRALHRMEEEAAKMEALVEQRALAGDESESELDADSSSDDDNLAYKPDAAALAKMTKGRGRSDRGRADRTDKEDEGKEKYRPPKISAVAPPSSFDDKAGPRQSNRKLQSMEEYLAEASDLPQAESSIGATIVGHGRGGVKTSKDKQRELEIQRYEESNFTRLPSTATKKTYKQKMAERANTFAGEDWSMFNNKRNLKEGTSRKRKPTSAWDRAKRKRT